MEHFRFHQEHKDASTKELTCIRYAISLSVVFQCVHTEEYKKQRTNTSKYLQNISIVISSSFIHL